MFVASFGTADFSEAAVNRIRLLARLDSVGVHESVEEAERADAILFVDSHQHPGDPFLNYVLRQRHDWISGATPCFVLDERDAPTYSLPGLYVGASRRMASYLPVRGAPYPLLDAEPVGTGAPDLLFSFMGAITHPSRERILRLRHPRGLLVDTTGVKAGPWIAAGEADASARKAFQHSLERSKFVLCPRGHGRASYRIYEALASGRVPVIISDSWLAPVGPDWENISVRVRERDCLHIPAILERLEPGWSEMSQMARAAYLDHFHRSRVWNHYVSSLSTLVGARRPRRWRIELSWERVALRSRLARSRVSALRPPGSRADLPAWLIPPRKSS